MRAQIYLGVISVFIGLVLGVAATAQDAVDGKSAVIKGVIFPASLPVELDLGKAVISTTGASFSRTGGLGTVRFLKGSERSSVSFSFTPLNLSTTTGIIVRLKNSSNQSIRVFGGLNNNPWVTDYVTVRPNETASLRIFLQRTSFYPKALETVFQKMNGIPGGQMKLWPDAEVDASSISVLTLFTIRAAETTAIEIEGASTFRLPQPDFGSGSPGPLVDRYGQLVYKEWPGKIASGDALRESAKTEDEDLSRHPGPSEFDRFGGWLKGPRLKATGHFRVSKYANRWWFVDPDGRLFWSNGITTVTFHEETDVRNRSAYFRDPPVDGDFLARNLSIKYGPSWEKKVEQRTATRLRSWGLNTIGPWSDGSFMRSGRTPYTFIFSSKEADDRIDPHSREWYRLLRTQVAEKAAELDRDPWCLGVFVDNEIHASTDPAWWEDYYREINGLMREFLPHKLYLGSRFDFAGFPNVNANRLEIVRIAARFTDVISFNQYRYTLEDFSLPIGVDRPVIIGEFHFGALDRGLLHTGLRSVVDQNQRAEAYVNYVESALRNPQVVGVHWFQMYDEPVTGRGDGENYQIGFLDVCDQPYPETIEASRRIGSQLYLIRAWESSPGNNLHDSDRRNPGPHH